MAATVDVKLQPLMSTARIGEVLSAIKVLYQYDVDETYGRLEVSKPDALKSTAYKNWAFTVSSTHPELVKAIKILFNDAPNLVGEHLRLRELLTRVEGLAVSQNKKLQELKGDVQGPMVQEVGALHDELTKKTEELLQLQEKYDKLNGEYLEESAKNTALVVELGTITQKLESYEKQFGDGQ